MPRISLKFAKKDNKICLCAHLTGTQIRHYKTVGVLKNPNLSKWNPKIQGFIVTTDEDVRNNALLKEFIEPFKQLLVSQEFESGKELFEAYDLAEQERVDKIALEKAKELTLEVFLENVIDELKNPTKRKPSANFMTYQTLLSKLRKEGTIMKTPVCKVNRNTFVRFSKFVLESKARKGKGKNYVSLMKLLIATVNRARKAGLTDYTPNFPYMEYAPVINRISDRASDLSNSGGTVQSLTPEQYESFLSLNLNSIQMRKVSANHFKELYTDFCILLYEMKSRPIDIMKLRWDNITYDNHYKRWVCTYIPTKKKNYSLMRENDNSPLVVQFLTPKALEIILKYKAQSTQGYVLPFAHNKKQWDLNNPEQYHSYYTQQNRAQGRINRFLWKVGDKLGLPYHLTLYAFRRTAITKAVTENKMPLTMIAKIAGTSVSMIERHYTNYLQALAAY